EEAMPVIRSDDVEHARRERPPLAARQIRHLALAGDDGVGLPVVLQPDDYIHALPDPVLVVREAHAVGGGQEARRAKRVVAHRQPDASEPLELLKRANEYGPPPLSRSRDARALRRRPSWQIRCRRWAPSTHHDLADLPPPGAINLRLQGRAFSLSRRCRHCILNTNLRRAR